MFHLFDSVLESIFYIMSGLSYSGELYFSVNLVTDFIWKPVFDCIFDFNIVFVFGWALFSISRFKTSYGFNVLKLVSFVADIYGISMLDKFLNDPLLFLLFNLLMEGMPVSLTVVRWVEFILEFVLVWLNI